MKQRPFPHRRLCCPTDSSSTTAASDALPAHRPFPGLRLSSRDAPTANPAGPPGRGGPPQFPSPPSERSTPSTPGSSSGLRFQALHPFHGLRREGPGSALPFSRPAGRAHQRRGRLRLTLRTARSPPPQGLLTLGFDPTRFPTEPPACYRASWQLPGPDPHRPATTSLRMNHDITSSTSILLGALAGRGVRRSAHPCLCEWLLR